MEIRVTPKGILLGFPISETKVALSVLKAIYTVSPAKFVKDAIDEIEMSLQPKQLPFINYQHLCSKCFMMVDEKGDNALMMTKDGDVTWKHKRCVDLKQKRPN